ncbi:MAG: type II toxin-antitoxin system death-on-curing family toxin [Rickettsiales bacterium]
MTGIEPFWVPEAVVLDFHRQQLAAHGGGEGVRDMGLLQSALARPMNAFYYNQVVSLSKLAACYAYGIAKNHAFIDGNKRTALVVAIAFIEANGFALSSTQEENYFAFYNLAAGASSEEQLADWLEGKMVPLA